MRPSHCTYSDLSFPVCNTGLVKISGDDGCRLLDPRQGFHLSFLLSISSCWRDRLGICCPDQETGTQRGGETLCRSHSRLGSVDSLWVTSLGWVPVAVVTDLHGQPASSRGALYTPDPPLGPSTNLKLAPPPVLASRVELIQTVFHVASQKPPPNAPRSIATTESKQVLNKRSKRKGG